MRENIYYQRNRETILNRAKSIIKTMKKDWERAKNKNRELSEEEKNKVENLVEIDTAICLKKIKKE